MKNDQDQWLLLDCQLCFPLYACARKIVAAYHPYLKKIGLTYTQYITMMVLWQEREISVKDLGTRLYLDSGTLTPVLKTWEPGFILIQEPSRPFSRPWNARAMLLVRAASWMNGSLLFC